MSDNSLTLLAYCDMMLNKKSKRLFSTRKAKQWQKEYACRQHGTKIKSMIEGGDFSVGDKLPNENDFASQLGVSRSTLREAIRTLTASGMLEIKRGKGTFVTANTIIESSDISEISSGLDDLFEMRLMFEPDCAYYAALRATDDEIETICKYGEAIEKRYSAARTEHTRSRSSTKASQTPLTIHL